MATLRKFKLARSSVRLDDTPRDIIINVDQVVFAETRHGETFLVFGPGVTNKTIEGTLEDFYRTCLDKPIW